MDSCLTGRQEQSGPLEVRARFPPYNSSFMSKASILMACEQFLFLTHLYFILATPYTGHLKTIKRRKGFGQIRFIIV